MLVKPISLEDTVMRKFGNVENFAAAIGWSNRKAQSIVSGQQTKTVRDMEDMAKALGMKQAEEFMAVFFMDASI